MLCRKVLQMTSVHTHILSRVPLRHASQWFLGNFQPDGGKYPFLFLLLHPFPNAGMNEKILKCSSVELQPGLPCPWWQQMDTESDKKADIGWSCAFPGYHSKVTLRSSQGHCKVKLAKNMIFRIFYRFQTHLECRWELQITVLDT